jgi:hypothetical protein
MTMREGERWICSNPECRCEVVVVIAAAAREGTNPRCSCGFPMKKRYTTPAVKVLHKEEARDFHEKFFAKVS